jgi:hypothetical protein
MYNVKKDTSDDGKEFYYLEGENSPRLIKHSDGSHSLCFDVTETYASLEEMETDVNTNVVYESKRLELLKAIKDFKQV